MGVKDYDLNPDNNTQINGINIAEGCPPSGINNAIRQLMADVKADSDDQNNRAQTPATSTSPGIVKVGSGITIAPDGTISIDPWNIFPLHVPIAAGGVTFGGSDGRRAIMLGETVARENWVLCDGGSNGTGGTVPDLRGRMILGASAAHSAYSTGGSETHSHEFSGQTWDTTLTETQIPAHKHSPDNLNSFICGAGNGEAQINAAPENKSYTLRNYTSMTGGSQPHAHGLLGMTQGASTLPPYYALSYIMRIY